MEKNYYELLQIDKNASPEIIEKAYKTLVKKYHPDLQSETLKNNCEEILKKINEAYEILSDVNKRKLYDSSIYKNHISEEDYNNLNKENKILKEELNSLKASQVKNTKNPSNINNIPTNKKTYTYTKTIQPSQNQQTYNEEMQKAINKAYHDAYIQDLKRRGFKIKYKKKMKDYISIFISIIVIIVIFFILWQVPTIKNYFINLYNNNTLIHNIINVFLNIFK